MMFKTPCHSEPGAGADDGDRAIWIGTAHLNGYLLLTVQMG